MTSERRYTSPTGGDMYGGEMSNAFSETFPRTHPSAWRILFLLVRREADALSTMLHNLDTAQKRVFWLNGFAALIVLTGGIFGRPAFLELKRAALPPAFLGTAIVFFGMAIWSQAALAGLKEARFWTSGGDIVWRLSGVSSWLRAAVAVVVSMAKRWDVLCFALIALLILGSIAKTTIGVTIGAFFWVAACAALGGGWSAAAERQVGDNRTVLHAVGIFAGAFVMGSGYTLIARGSSVGLLIADMLFLGLAYVLWRIAAISEAAPHASTEVSDAIYQAQTSADLILPNTSGTNLVGQTSSDSVGVARLFTQQSVWKLLAWRELIHISRQPINMVALLVLGYVLQILIIVIAVGIPQMGEITRTLPISSAIGFTSVLFLGQFVAEIRANERRRAWWGWIRLSAPSLESVVVGHSVFLFGLLFSWVALGTLLYVVLSRNLALAGVFFLWGTAAAIALPFLDTAVGIVLAAWEVEGQLFGRLVITGIFIMAVATFLLILRVLPFFAASVLSLLVAVTVAGVSYKLALRQLSRSDFAPTLARESATAL